MKSPNEVKFKELTLDDTQTVLELYEKGVLSVEHVKVFIRSLIRQAIKGKKF